MKAKKILPIIVLIAAASVLSTCDAFGTIIGTIGIPINAKAYNNNGTDPRSAVRAVGDTLASGDTISPNELNVYSSLGSLTTSITPTKFVVASYFRVLLSNGEIVSLGQGFLDYAQGITINIGDVPAGITVSAISIEIHLDSAAYFPEINQSGHSYVEFPFTGTLPTSYSAVVYEDPVFTPTSEGGTAKIHFKTIIPKAHGGGETSNIHQFIYGGDTRKLIEGQIQPAEIFPNIPNNYPGLENTFGSTLVIPMNSITIPSNAKSITLNISWNLDGIISQYGTSPNFNFILKNGWWNDLYITASVE